MKLIIAVCCVFFSMSAFSQSRIEGIGKLKLKKTLINSLDSLGNEAGFEKAKPYDRKEYRERILKGRYGDEKGTISEIKPDTAQMYSSPYAHLCQNVRVFNISKMKIAEIVIRDTYLTFRNDTLVDIHCDWSTDLAEAIELKYGKAEVEQTDKEITCVLTFTGQKVTHTETMIYKRWHNDNIVCTSAIGSYYNTECKEQILSYVSISTYTIGEQIRKCDELVKKQLDDRKNADKKKQLKDF